MTASIRESVNAKVDNSMESKPLVVSAIPAYNEEKTTGRVVLQAQRYVERIAVCDDGSRDLTAEIVLDKGALRVL